MTRGPADELARLCNLGPASARMLNAAGIRTEAELRDAGAVNAYRLLALHGFRPSLNFLWAIEGALRGINWLEIPAEERARLKEELAAPWDARAMLGLE